MQNLNYYSRKLFLPMNEIFKSAKFLHLQIFQFQFFFKQNFANFFIQIVNFIFLCILVFNCCRNFRFSKFVIFCFCYELRVFLAAKFCRICRCRFFLPRNGFSLLQQKIMTRFNFYYYYYEYFKNFKNFENFWDCFLILKNQFFFIFGKNHFWIIFLNF